MSYLTEEEQREFAKESIGGYCASCEFWNPREEPTWQNPPSGLGLDPYVFYSGECRKRAPSHVVLEEGEDPVSYWPETDWNDWCGEHCGNKPMRFVQLPWESLEDYINRRHS